MASNTVVYQESRNNFMDADQAINSRQIMSAIYGPFSPQQVGLNPSRVGEVYIQIPEGTTEGKLKAWVAIAQHAAGAKWEPLVLGDTGSMDNVAFLDKDNDFLNLKQTIDGDQLITFINGGDKNPGQSGIAPKFNGQFYIAFKTLSTGPDVAVWVAYNNTWVPVVAESVDTANLAKLDQVNTFTQSNIFEDRVQRLGPPEDNRWLTGFRIKSSGNAPIADASWEALIEGERTLYIHTDSDNVKQYSIWTAIPGLLGSLQWVMTWSTAGGSVDLTDYAKIDQENHFSNKQRIGDDANNAYFISGRRTAFDPLDAGSPDFMPFVPGDILVREYNDSGATEQEVYVAGVGGDADSWIKMYDSKLTLTTMESRITELEAMDDVHDAKFTEFEDDYNSMSTALGTIDSDVTEIYTKVNMESDKLQSTVVRMDNVENRVAALETHHIDNQSTFSEHDGRVDVLEADKITMQGQITNLLATIADLETRLAALETPA